MTLRDRLSEYTRACFSGLWIVSHEHQDALAEIAALCRDEGWRWAAWDLEQGWRSAGATPLPEAGGGDPLAAVRAAAAWPASEQPTLLVLANFHRFLGSAEIVQAVERQVLAGRQSRVGLLILSPVVQLPVELEKLFLVLDHELPDRPQLAQIARGVATETGELPTGPDLERVLDAAAGLTRYEAEGAFSLALVRHGRIEPATLWDLKCQTLRKNGLLSLYRGQEQFADLGGLEALKAFCLRALRPRTGRAAPAGTTVPRSRGVLLLGVPGTGKSAFCKALGRETGRPTLILDVGSLLGSLVGQTEERTRQALRIADAMAPCVLMVDELEKALAGASGTAAGDSGVSARLLGSLLSWLNDHESDVFVVCTANDVRRLPPEFSRAERFDGVFFLDLPGPDARQTIWRQYQAAFGLDPEQPRPADEHWTGAEIRACCRLAALLDLPLTAAAQNVAPVAVTAAETVEALRSWASGRCLDAERAGLYRRGDREGPEPPRRRLSRRGAEPGCN